MDVKLALDGFGNRFEVGSGTGFRDFGPFQPLPSPSSPVRISVYIYIYICIYMYILYIYI